MTTSTQTSSSHSENTHVLPSQSSEDPSLPTTHAETTTTLPQQHSDESEHLAPEVAALKSMFPDFDALILQSVLESVNLNQEQAIEALLGMSDPSYVPAQDPTGQQQHSQGDNDTSLDAAIARQLALEDEEERRHSRRNPSGQTWPRRGAGVPVGAEDTFAYDQQRQGRTSGGEVPYEVRTSNRQQQQAGYVTGNERGDFQEFQETVNKIAESGKRTFASVVSKIKAKINEFEQNGGIGQFTGGSSEQHPPPRHDGPPSGTSRLPNPTYTTSGSVDPYSQSAPPQPSTRGVDRHTASQAYAPPPSSGAGTDLDWEHATAGWRGEPTTSTGPSAIKGYDVNTDTPETGSLAQAPLTSAQTPSTPPPTNSTLSQGGTDIPGPPTTQSGSPINAAKIGLLPKRPVSLLTSQHPSEEKPTHEHDEEAEELEYLENPFEDDNKKR